MNNMAVIVRNLTYYYPDCTVPTLDGISLEIERGRFVVIMGMNGAGKSTLALCLNGIIPQLFEGKMEGEIWVGNRDVRKTPTQSMADTVGIVLQDPESQIIGLTVAEDVAFGPRNLGLPPEEVLERVGSELAETGLSGYEERKTDTLSGGEKQRLVLAGVLAMHQEVLVLDEPASELDPAGRAQLYEILDQLHQEGSRTIIVIEHAIEDILDKADEVIVMQAGKIVWRGKPQLLFQSEQLPEQFGLKPLMVEQSFSTFPFRIGAPGNRIEAHGIEAQGDRLEATGKKIEVRRKNGHAPKGSIIIRNLTHLYPDSAVPSLKDINLDIQPGEYIALIGPNGAGKTTLTKHFNALLKPTKGDVWVSGKNTRDLDTAALSQTVGYVFQNPDHQLFETTVERELSFSLRKAGQSSAMIKSRIEEVLLDFELFHHRDVHPLTLGRSVRQLLTLATAIVFKPDILVLDEPTKGLDWPGIKKITAVIRKLHLEGATVIVITHDMEFAAQAQRVIALKNGSTSS